MKCLSCESTNVEKIFSLGDVPPVNTFLKTEEVHKEEKFPLGMVFCQDCSLVQLEKVVDPNILFKNYQHLSSASFSNVKHLKELANILCGNAAGKKLLEIGSNDGTFLRFAAQNGVRAVGVDPALNLAEFGNCGELRTITKFFNAQVADEIVASEGKFDLVVGLNVFAHSPSFVDMLKGVAKTLKDDGWAVFEFAYVFSTLLTGCFDTTYHEHVSCFSLHAFNAALNRAGLNGFHAEKIATQGGSLRVYVTKGDTKSWEYRLMLMREEADQVFDIKTYDIIRDKVVSTQDNLPRFVELLKSTNGKLIGLGAPARGVVLLNTCRITSDQIKYVIDDTPLKLDCLVPGTRIPVKGWDELKKDPGTAFLLLSWNYYSEIRAKLLAFGIEHGKIIVPFPKLEVREF